MQNGKPITPFSNRPEDTSIILDFNTDPFKYLDLLNSIFLILNADGEVVYINKKGAELLGYDKQDVVGKLWFDYFIPEHAKEDVQKVFNTLIKGDETQFEFYENPVRTKSGNERMISWHNTILKSKEGELRGTVSSGVDVTDREKHWGKKS